jgi:predicted O-methyltransferase YrrM
LQQMDAALNDLLSELEGFGASHDASTKDRSQRMLNITRDTGEFLRALIRAADARRVLEIGTSNGYSTLWLADAVRSTHGSVTTVEIADHKVDLARENFDRSGLRPLISLVHADAAIFLGQAPESSYDFIFLDSERSEYPRWWPSIRRALRPGGSLVADNAISHAGEMEPFFSLLRSDTGFTASLVPVGNGELFAVKDLVQRSPPARAAGHERSS